MNVERAENDSSHCEEEIEVEEESFIHVVMDNAEEMSTVNANSNVRMIAIDSDSPALQIENKVCTFICWTNFVILLYQIQINVPQWRKSESNFFIRTYYQITERNSINLKQYCILWLNNYYPCVLFQLYSTFIMFLC